jgi:hypothetical protein
MMPYHRLLAWWRRRQLGSRATFGLAAEILALAPDHASSLLKILRDGLRGETEFARYQAAEALSTAVYPKYKFSEFGRVFLEDEEFLRYYTRSMDPNNWHSFDRKYTLNQLLKLVHHIDGDLAECGTYKGMSAYLMCRAHKGSSRRIHLFDSFEGLPTPDEHDGTYWSRGALQTSEDTVRETLVEFDNYVVYKGWIPERFSEVAQLRFSFVHIDVDLYRPTLASLQFFFPRMTSGGIILLDDYGFNSCPGARLAADEFFADLPERIVMLPTGQAFVMRH